MQERRNQTKRREEDRQHREVIAAASVVARYGRQALIGYMILLTSAIIAVAILQFRTNDLAVGLHTQLVRTSQLTKKLHASNLGACHRLNLLRAGDNQSHYADWQFFTLTAHLVDTSRRGVRTRAASKAFAKRLYGYASRLTWIPLTTSCEEAVAQADRFRAPLPIAFNQALPPYSALHLKAGE